MDIQNISAKALLITVKNPYKWFGVKYNMNIYRGCQHHCIYCDSRSECYRISDFDNQLIVKENAPALLDKELKAKKAKGIIGTGAMGDPYIPSELALHIMEECLPIVHYYQYPLHILTKSNLVLRDIDVLEKIKKHGLCVAFTITAFDDGLSKLIEPGAPVSSKRFSAMAILSELNITCGVCLMPVLPFITDTEENIISIIEKSKSCGAKFIYPGFGMTLRDRQRDYYYEKLNSLFPGLSEKYIRQFKNRYGVYANNYKKLTDIFYKRCRELNLETAMKDYANNVRYEQLKLM